MIEEMAALPPWLKAMGKGSASFMSRNEKQTSTTRSSLSRLTTMYQQKVYAALQVGDDLTVAVRSDLPPEGLLRNSEEVGNHMKRRMADWPKKHKLVGDVRVSGLMIGVELVKNKENERTRIGRA